MQWSFPTPVLKVLLIIALIISLGSFAMATYDFPPEIDKENFFEHEDEFEEFNDFVMDFDDLPHGEDQLGEDVPLNEDNLNNVDYAVTRNYTIDYPVNNILRQSGVVYDCEERGDVRADVFQLNEETLCGGYECNVGLGFYHPLLHTEGYPDNPYSVKYEGDAVLVETVGFEDEESEEYPRQFRSEPIYYTAVTRDFHIATIEDLSDVLPGPRDFPEIDIRGNVHTIFNCPAGTIYNNIADIIEEGGQELEGTQVACHVDLDAQNTEVPYVYTDDKRGVFNEVFEHDDDWSYSGSGSGDSGHESEEGYVFVETDEQEGEGSKSKTAEWEKELEEPITTESSVYFEGGVLIEGLSESRSDSCTSNSTTHSVSAESSFKGDIDVLVQEGGSGWNTVYSYDSSTSENVHIYEEYSPGGDITAVKVQMETEATGDTSSAGSFGQCQVNVSADAKGEVILTNLIMKKDYEVPSIEWDANQEHCEGIGGDWLDEDTDGLETDPEYFNHTRGSYRCCGDDWIWVYNLPVNYDPDMNQQDVRSYLEDDDNHMCLHDPLDPSVEEVVGFKSEELGEEGNYRCPQTDYEAYDPALTLADDEMFREDTTTVFGHQDDLFYLAGSADDTTVRTDIGKWTPWHDEQNTWLEDDAMFCYHEFDPDSEHGENFEWMSIEEASDQNQMVCDIYLGYNWTGSQCCYGDREETTFDDPELACNSTARLEDVKGGDYEFSSPDLKNEFFEQCDLGISTNPYNPACFEGKSVPNNTATYSEPGTKDVFNKNGIFRFCERADGEDTQYKDEGFEHVEKCGLRGTESFPHVCTYNNDSWLASDMKGPYLGRYEEYQTGEFSREELENNVNTSSLPFDEGDMPDNLVDKQQQECCFFGSCWNGTHCVEMGRYDEIGSYGMYKVEDDEWVPYEPSDAEGGQSNDEDIYMCHEGSWMESDVEFNWYVDYEQAGFCPEEHQCLYKQKGVDEHMRGYELAGLEEEYRREEGEFLCTAEENVYTEDHYCQAMYEDDEVVDSQWTSRTKLVALQLRQIAKEQGDGDYTLFCGHKEDSVNAPEELYEGMLPEGFDVNNVCVIEYGEKTAMGFAFNSHNETFDPMGDFLFGANGFVNRVDLEDELSCQVEFIEEGEQGAYSRCVDDELWVNNKTKSVIYSRDGIDVAANQLPAAEIGVFDSEVEEMMEGLEDTVSDDVAQARMNNPELLLTASDFRNLYVDKTGTEKIVGFMEERWDTTTHGEHSIPRYVAVRYPNSDEVCEMVDFVQEKEGYRIYCNEYGGDEYVIGKHYPDEGEPEPHSPDFWKGLAPRVRVI